MNVFNKIKGINESKTLAKLISCGCRCEFDGMKCNSRQTWNNNKCQCWCKNQQIIVHVKKIVTAILVHVLAGLIRIVRLMNTWKAVNAKRVNISIQIDNVKEINIKNRAYCSFDYIINVRDLDSGDIMIGEKSCKNSLIYYIGYVTPKSVKVFVPYHQ